MDDKSHLDSIPVELWREIWKYAQRDDYKSLSNACHLFRDILLPYSFESLVYTAKAMDPRDPLSSDRTWRDTFYESAIHVKELASNPVLASLVRKCHLDLFCYSDQGKEITRVNYVRSAYHVFLRELAAALPAFPNLQEIYFGPGIDVSQGIISALATLPHLNEAHFSFAPFGDTRGYPRIKLQKLYLTDVHDMEDDDFPQTMDFLSPDRIESMSLRSFILAPMIMQSLSLAGICRHLTHLSLRLMLDFACVLFDLMRSCPELKVLRIEDCMEESDSGPLFSLPPTAAPHLETYEGPPGLGLLILPGRPVRHVNLDDGPWVGLNVSTIRTHLTELARSTGPIVNLKLPSMTCHPDIIVTIAEHFPDLRTLKLFLHDNEGHTGRVSIAGARTPGDNEDYFGIQLDGNSEPIQVPFIYTGLMHRIALAQLRLPPQIEMLNLTRRSKFPPNRPPDMPFKPFTSSAASHMVGMLGKHYPSLRQLTIGVYQPPFCWCKDSEGTWNVSEEYEYDSSG